MARLPEPQWYQEAIIYQIHVKAFFDSTDDGYGDFQGLIQKLDYIASLGVTAVWLLPFFPSPLRDDGVLVCSSVASSPEMARASMETSLLFFVGVPGFANFSVSAGLFVSLATFWIGTLGSFPTLILIGSPGSTTRTKDSEQAEHLGLNLPGLGSLIEKTCWHSGHAIL